MSLPYRDEVDCSSVAGGHPRLSKGICHYHPEPCYEYEICRLCHLYCVVCQEDIDPNGNMTEDTYKLLAPTRARYQARRLQEKGNHEK